MFLVVWTIDRGRDGTTGEHNFTDHWSAHDEYAEAEQWFESLLKMDELWSATIAQPVKSTEADYLGEWGER
jgi:hypothetical protein